LKRLGTAVGSLQLVAALVLATCCVALAAQIPALVSGSHTLVAVEPLLQDLNVEYTIRGVVLEVDGRVYPNPLEERNGMAMADAFNFAHFLHLDLTRRNGVLVFSPSDGAGSAPVPPPTQADIQAVRLELLAQLNAHRADQGLAALGTDATAQIAAQYQADDMSSAGIMRHQDSTGRTPMERFNAFGGHASWYGENVGWYQADPDGETGVWSAVSKLDAEMMAEQPPDDGHREAILSPHYQAVGIGIAIGPNGLYLAEDFVGH
jgi:uncharacterized protein YkwD